MEITELLELQLKAERERERRIVTLEDRVRQLELRCKLPRPSTTVNHIMAPNIPTTKAGYRLHEIAKSAGVSVGFVRKQIREGKLTATKLGSALIVLDAEFTRWLQGNRNVP